jgi:UDP-GlcNAc:undecaprenyl-phosphate/decaprenyl-phosphate GlcNAc-1-phosphate transferase
MLYFSTLLISFLITITLIPIARRAALSLNVIDMPNARKVHASPIPRCGGVAMAVGTLFPVMFLYHTDREPLSIIIGAAVIVIFGVLDDMLDTSYRIKLAGQVIAGLTVILLGGVSIKSLGMLLPGDIVLPDYAAIPLTLIVIVGVTNAVNFADGLDGLAGGLSLLSFSLIGYLAFMSDNYFIVFICFAMAGAIFGFLKFNNYPANLFMGDAGSQLLGFLIVTLSLALTQGGSSYNVLLPLLIAGVPVLDTLRVMFIRAREGRSMANPDKNHIHHRLIGFGLFQTEAVFIIYVLQTFLVLTAFLFRFHSEWSLLMIYILFSGGLLVILTSAERQGWTLERQGAFDLIAIKEKLRIIFREEYMTVKASFLVLKLAVPSVFLVSCLIPGEMPAYMSVLAALFGLCLAALLIFRRKLIEGGAIRLFLYLIIPLVLYYGEADRSPLFGDLFITVYDGCLLALMLPAIAVMRFTRRRKGFRTTPMDFLLFLIAVSVAVMPGFSGVSTHMKLLAAKIIVLFFAYEVLAGEMRERGKVKLGWITAGTFLLMAGKAVFNV